MGVIGVTLGVAFGFLVCFLQQQFGLVPLPYAESFIIRAYPVSMMGSDFLAVIVAALVLIFLASLYPARRAAYLALTSTERWRSQ